jgi:hypothetical protein
VGDRRSPSRRRPGRASRPERSLASRQASRRSPPARRDGARCRDGHPLPDERVPGVVNLASLTDTGRMKRSLSSAGRIITARDQCVDPKSPLSSTRSVKRRNWSASIRTPISARALCRHRQAWSHELSRDRLTPERALSKLSLSRPTRRSGIDGVRRGFTGIRGSGIRRRTQNRAGDHSEVLRPSIILEGNSSGPLTLGTILSCTFRSDFVRSRRWREGADRGRDVTSRRTTRVIARRGRSIGCATRMNAFANSSRNKRSGSPISSVSWR